MSAMTIVHPTDDTKIHDILSYYTNNKNSDQKVQINEEFINVLKINDSSAQNISAIEQIHLNSKKISLNNSNLINDQILISKQKHSKYSTF